MTSGVTASRRDGEPEASRSGGEAFGRLVEAFRNAQSAVLGADLPDAEAEQAIELLDRLRELAAPHVVPEPEQPAGNRDDLPGRGNPMVPPFQVESTGARGETFTVSFPRPFQGYAAVHGGAVALLFDELLGRLAQREGELSRTAYLHVNYRHLTPLESPLRVEVTVDRVEGRKIFVTGRLLDGRRVLADAEGLWVVPRSG